MAGRGEIELNASVLGPRQAGVDLHYIAFDNPSPDPTENTRHLVAAIADARSVSVEREAGLGSAA